VTTKRAPAEILDYLGPRLIHVLASLDGAPEAVCQATVQLLPFGSRAALEVTGLAVRGDEIDEAGHVSLTLTPLAFEVMSVAAAHLEQSATAAADLADWDARADRMLNTHPITHPR
jgi:hypothetical protein